MINGWITLFGNNVPSRFIRPLDSVDDSPCFWPGRDRSLGFGSATLGGIDRQNPGAWIIH